MTDVSGRGVGMDVVKRNITALNGTVEIDSAEGFGMKVSVRLPLTLAIMDGMSVGIGNEVYLLPLSSVIESFQVDANAVNTVGQGAQLVKVREEYMPVIEMEKLFQVPRFSAEKCNSIMVVIEADGVMRRVARGRTPWATAGRRQEPGPTTARCPTCQAQPFLGMAR